MEPSLPEMLRSGSFHPIPAVVMRRTFFAPFVLIALAGASCTDRPDPSAALEAVPSEAAAVQPQADLPVVRVFKSPTCGCCSLWARHMEQNGFRVEESNTSELAAIKQQLGVPGELSACHTALVGEYIVEGHVPAEDVKRLLAEKPAGVGIGVAGMPIGSPGMEVEGQPAEPYEVILFGETGRAVFARH